MRDSIVKGSQDKGEALQLLEHCQDAACRWFGCGRCSTSTTKTWKPLKLGCNALPGP